MERKNNILVVGLSTFLLLFVVGIALFNYKIAHEVDASQASSPVVTETTVAADPIAFVQSFLPSSSEDVVVETPSVSLATSQQDKPGSDKPVHEAPLSNVLLLQ